MTFESGHDTTTRVAIVRIQMSLNRGIKDLINVHSLLCRALNKGLGIDFLAQGLSLCGRNWILFTCISFLSTYSKIQLCSNQYNWRFCPIVPLGNPFHPLEMTLRNYLKVYLKYFELIKTTVLYKPTELETFLRDALRSTL